MNIFITGGSTGIGAALAKEYIKRGHRVGVCGRSREKFEREFASELVCHPQLIFYEVDVREREKLLAIMKSFAEGGQTLDLVIANAGVATADKVNMPNFETAREVISTNIFGVLNTFEGAIPLMMENANKGSLDPANPTGKGHLVAVASVAGFLGLPGTAAYSASKAAVLKFCETLSIDLLPMGIHVTAIAPGFIDTPLTKRNRHAMPFLMSADKAAELIIKAIERKKDLFIFPLRMKWLITFLYYLPRGLYIVIMRSMGKRLLAKKKS